jgi:hypothetical protein
MTLQWNEAELMLRETLNILVGTGTAQIVTAELGARGLTEALQTFAHDVLPEDSAQAVLHAVKYAELTRSHRNYYVHGVVSEMRVNDEPFGIIRAVSAKGKTLLHEEQVSITKIDAVARHAQILTRYVQGVNGHLLARLIPSRPQLVPPLKPPLPERLTRPQRSLRELWQPLQSSGE